MTTPRLVGLAQGDPQTPTTGSGAAAKFVLDALGRRYPLVARSGVELTPGQRRAIAAATFRPSRRRWKARLNWHRTLALEARSRNSARALADIADPFDFVFQVFGLFQTRGAPYVLYIDNTIELSRRHWPAWVEAGPRDLERLYAWERRLYGDALHVFAQGSPHADSVVSFYGVPRERTSVVGGGANFVPLPELSHREREPVVLFVGRDWQRKGGDRLIEAFRHVRERVPQARLQVVGTDDAPRGEPGVEVLGLVRGRDKMAALYESASVFCLPSRYDPYGLAIAEGMAYGLPCIVTRVGALDEVVIEDETGLVVPPEDTEALGTAMVRLLTDPELAGRLGAAARRRVETHQNWDAAVERMAPDLERVAAELAGDATRTTRSPARPSTA
jgi:glycosyltransferase involved in cell wall biosynthesis